MNNPVICAECEHFDTWTDGFEKPRYEINKRKIYSSKPDWCPIERSEPIKGQIEMEMK